jgi:peptide/nickel transport system substrate-binding protein
MLAEANKELAFSSSKSTMLDVDWTNYIDGPSLLILKKYLDQARAENYIPYAPTLSQYITAEEARLRYENLLTWFTRKGHFWLGTGLFYLEQVNSIEKSVVMERNPDFPDPADKWSQFGEPQIAVVDVSGPVKVKIGEEATFEAFVTFQDTPYPQADLNTVKYLLYDASGGLITTGLAEAVADGHFKVVLSPEVSQKLLPGANKIEFVVVSNVVSIPTFTAKEFLAEK